MSRGDKQMNLRLPAGVHEMIHEASKVNLRSMNAEVVARLEYSFGENVDLGLAKPPIATDRVKVTFRASKKLLDEIELIAEFSERSVEQQIIFALKSFLLHHDIFKAEGFPKVTE